MPHTLILFVAAVFGSTLISPVAAKPTPLLSIKSTIEKEIVTVDANGRRRTTRVAVEKVVPGETVIYTYGLTNAGALPAEPVLISAPIPEHMIYKDKSAVTAGATVRFSIDNGKTFASADELEVVTADGKRRPAGASDYTHIRWQLSAPLASGASHEVAFRAVLQ